MEWLLSHTLDVVAGWLMGREFSSYARSRLGQL